MKLRIGTRKSELALRQAGIVRAEILKKFPRIEAELVPVSTGGDRLRERPLTDFGGGGAFTKELEEALLSGKIDLAVHSAKDLPAALPEGLSIGAVLTREEAADVLVTHSGISVYDLPAGSVIGTGSERRRLELLRANPGVSVRPVRGNVGTRLDKLRRREFDGLVLAAAGLNRLGGDFAADLHLEYLDKADFIPAAGQGFLAVEARAGEFTEVLAAVHDAAAGACLLAERTFLSLMGGGCSAPCAAYCERRGHVLTMRAMAAQDGLLPRTALAERALRTEPAALTEAAVSLAQDLAGKLRLKKVYLVGAGPGDAGLVTQKARACIRAAEVVLYDALTAPSLLNEAPLTAELVCVGKRAGKPHISQEEISALLVSYAGEGRRVVRLKGGDPYVFGRGGEEALALAEAGIPFEVIPGVTSAVSVPAGAGIPVTHRGLASSFHVVTGRRASGPDGGASAPDYETLARTEGTLVFLMGLSALEETAAGLLEHGRPAGTPAAVIENGTRAGQRCVVSDLEHIAGRARKEGLRAPAVIVVGETAGLARVLAQKPSGPLCGVRVLVTGSRYMVSEMEKALRPLGAEPLAVSLIEPRLKESSPALNRRIFAELSSYTWLVFLSGNGVDLFFALLRREGVDLRGLAHLRFAAIGRRTADALAVHGFLCDFVPREYSAAGLAREWIPGLSGADRVLLARAREGSRLLPEALLAAGIDFTNWDFYETWIDRRRGEELNARLEEADYCVIASSTAARAFGELAEEPRKIKTKLVCIGPYTEKTLVGLGFPVCAAAAEYTADGVAAAILALEQNRGRHS